jgi:hypothetical protein
MNKTIPTIKFLYLDSSMSRNKQFPIFAHPNLGFKDMLEYLGTTSNTLLAKGQRRSTFPIQDLTQVPQFHPNPTFSTLNPSINCKLVQWHSFQSISSRIKQVTIIEEKIKRQF